MSLLHQDCNDVLLGFIQVTLGELTVPVGTLHLSVCVKDSLLQLEYFVLLSDGLDYVIVTDALANALAI